MPWAGGPPATATRLASSKAVSEGPEVVESGLSAVGHQLSAVGFTWLTVDCWRYAGRVPSLLILLLLLLHALDLVPDQVPGLALHLDRLTLVGILQL